MGGTTTLILGGGWGGLAAAHHLRSLAPSQHRIVVIERNTTFSLGVSNLKLMTGERAAVDDVQRRMENLKRPGIDWLHAEVRSVDPQARTVDTDGGTVTGDHLILALGAELAPGAVPGFDDAAFNLYEADQAAAIHNALAGFEGGRIVVLVAGAPYRCPAAPYEAAMLVESWTRAAGIRDGVGIDLYTPESSPMGVAGPAVGEALCSFMEERGITAHFEHQATAVNGASRTIRFAEKEAGFDLLIGIPPHRAPGPLRDAGLVDATGYVPTHPQTLEILSDPDTLEVDYPGVYAIGDATAIRLLNSMLLPKAGVFADAEAQVVAAAIAAAIEGEPRPGIYDGHGFCYVDVGDGLAAYGRGDFYAYPGPRVTLEAPTAEFHEAKQAYEDLLDTWFHM